MVTGKPSTNQNGWVTRNCVQGFFRIQIPMRITSFTPALVSFLTLSVKEQRNVRIISSYSGFSCMWRGSCMQLKYTGTPSLPMVLEHVAHRNSRPKHSSAVQGPQSQLLSALPMSGKYKWKYAHRESFSYCLNRRKQAIDFLLGRNGFSFRVEFVKAPDISIMVPPCSRDISSAPTKPCFRFYIFHHQKTNREWHSGFPSNNRLSRILICPLRLMVFLHF